MAVKLTCGLSVSLHIFCKHWILIFCGTFSLTRGLNAPYYSSGFAGSSLSMTNEVIKRCFREF